MRNTQYSIELSFHQQPFNTTYTIQCRVNCPIKFNVENFNGKPEINLVVKWKVYLAVSRAILSNVGFEIQSL